MTNKYGENITLIIPKKSHDIKKHYNSYYGNVIIAMITNKNCYYNKRKRNNFYIKK